MLACFTFKFSDLWSSIEVSQRWALSQHSCKSLLLQIRLYVVASKTVFESVLACFTFNLCLLVLWLYLAYKVCIYVCIYIYIYIYTVILKLKLISLNCH